MKQEPRLTVTDLRREAARLIAENRMPSLETLLSTISAVRQTYVPKILEARREAKIHVVKSEEA
jgi:hypothetical protein